MKMHSQFHNFPHILYWSWWGQQTDQFSTRVQFFLGYTFKRCAEHSFVLLWWKMPWKDDERHPWKRCHLEGRICGSKIHPFIVYTHFLLLHHHRGAARACPSCHRAKGGLQIAITGTHRRPRAISLTCMFLDCGRKLMQAKGQHIPHQPPATSHQPAHWQDRHTVWVLYLLLISYLDFFVFGLEKKIHFFNNNSGVLIHPPTVHASSVAPSFPDVRGAQYQLWSKLK